VRPQDWGLRGRAWEGEKGVERERDGGGERKSEREMGGGQGRFWTCLLVVMRRVSCVLQAAILERLSTIRQVRGWEVRGWEG
jgi:hypothetical protein